MTLYLFQSGNVDSEASHVHSEYSVPNPTVEESNNLSVPDYRRGDAKVTNKTHGEEGDGARGPDLHSYIKGKDRIALVLVISFPTSSNSLRS